MITLVKIFKEGFILNLFGFYLWVGQKINQQILFQKLLSADEPLGDNPHTYGLFWTPTKLEWYFDGVMVRDEGVHKGTQHLVPEDIPLFFQMQSQILNWLMGVCKVFLMLKYSFFFFLLPPTFLKFGIDHFKTIWICSYNFWRVLIRRQAGRSNAASIMFVILL